MSLCTDCHIHSNTSPDAADDIATICRAAIERGLTRICLTNHYEIFPGDPTPDDYLFDFDRYSDEVERAREAFGDRLEILKGVEFGQPHRHQREFEQIAARDFDMITASIHFLPMDFGIHWLWVQKESFINEVQSYFQQRYYEEMAAMAAFGGYNVVAHFDWPKRFFRNFQEDGSVYREIFSSLKRTGAVLEINTSAYSRGCEWFYPSPAILQVYREAGNRHLVVGSDAHVVEKLGDQFDKVEKFLETESLEIGYFKKRKFISLDEGLPEK